MLEIGIVIVTIFVVVAAIVIDVAGPGVGRHVSLGLLGRSGTRGGPRLRFLDGSRGFGSRLVPKEYGEGRGGRVGSRCRQGGGPC